jgi:hypothetical protein
VPSDRRAPASVEQRRDAGRPVSASPRFDAIQWIERRYVPITFVAFTLLTLVMTWPLPRYAGSAVQDLGDPLYQIWAMRWVQHQLPRDPGNLWDGNTGYPLPMALLFSEPGLSTSILSWPVYAVSGNEVLAYNVMFLLTFITVGAGMTLLVREITGLTGVGLLTGVLASFTPYRYGHLSHLNLLSYGWLLLGLWALVRYSRSRQARYAAAAAVMFIVQFLASDTLALMSLPLIGMAMAVSVWHERDRLDARFLVTLGLIPAVAIAAMVPAIIGRLRVNSYYGFTRELETIREMSATPSSYWSVSPVNHLWSGVLPLAYPNPLFIGSVTLLGAAAGLVLVWHYRPAWGIALIVAGAGAGILSLGPDATFFGRTVTLPFYWLYSYVPGMTTMRDVARFGMVGIIAAQVIAGIGFAALWLSLRDRVPADLRPLVAIGSLLLLTTLALVEFRSDVNAEPVDRSRERTAVYEWLAEQQHGPVLEIPADGLLRDVLVTTQQIYYSTYHWQPIVAAYASFVPQSHIEFLVHFHDHGAATSHVSLANVGLLQDLGIRYVVIHHDDSYDWRLALDVAERVPDMVPAGVLGDASVYLLEPGARQAIETRVELPGTVAAGHDAVGALVTWNPNSTGGITTLDHHRTARVEWRDAAGELVLSTTSQVWLPMVTDTGIRPYPLEVATPREPGRHQVEVRVGKSIASGPVAVEVVAREPESATLAPLELLDVAWTSGVVRAGDVLNVSADWLIHERLPADLALTVQLLDRDYQLVAQLDRRPFPGEHTVDRVDPGGSVHTVAGLEIPADLAPDEYYLLLAFYVETNPALPRMPILFADGSVETQAIFDGVHVVN